MRFEIGTCEKCGLAVEKDFACLDGSNRDDKDTFLHPLGGKVC